MAPLAFDAAEGQGAVCHVECTLTATTGQITVTARLNVCPVIFGLSATPLQLNVGETARLWATANDLDSGPRGLSLRWESDGGTLAGDGLEASLTCVQAGRTTVRVHASDGACERDAAVVVTCSVFQQPRLAWPGVSDVQTLDPVSTFTQNISGANYVVGTAGKPDTLWVVQNGPSRIYPLLPQPADAASGLALPADGPWRAGRALTYPTGAGEPDSEDLTIVGDAPIAYVAAERDNTESNTSRLSVLRYDLGSDADPLVATHEWNLTAQLPAVGSNLGLEGITYIPDEFLVAQSFFDERAGRPYDPSAYPAHAGGLFFVGDEADGMVYGFALNHDNLEADRITSFSSGQPQVMALDFDKDIGLLWTACDDNCQGDTTVLGIASSAGAPNRGKFQLLKALSRPSGIAQHQQRGHGAGSDLPV